jgi:hypothetical protein
MLTTLANWSGIDWRSAVALIKALILIDLRGQHYARATATRPGYALSPLFLVVGQCLTLSALSSGFLFARVDVFFFAFMGISQSMLVLATTILVEFQEIVLDPNDLEVIGHRPVSPRTYAAARFVNLMFYFVLMHTALNLFPLILGAGLRDAGPWYAPAYFLASLVGDLAVMAVVILVLSLGKLSPRLDGLKEVLAWTQILLIMVVFYGGQLMLRDSKHSIQLWAADPPAWTMYLPSTWLSWFVEDAAVAPSSRTLGLAGILAVVLFVSIGFTVARMAWLYRVMQPVTRSGARRVMPMSQVGAVPARGVGWLVRTSGERIGYWLSRTLLVRDRDLGIRCLLSFNLALAVVVVGILTDQFANPCIEAGTTRIVAPVVAVYLLPLALPGLVHHLAFCKDNDASWLLLAGPLESMTAFARGACKAVMLWVVTPLCIVFGVTLMFVWRDPLSAILHATLAWALCWPTALASLWLILQAAPFTLSPVRGGSLALPPIPLATMSLIGFALTGVHMLCAPSPWFWLAMFAGCIVASPWIEGQAEARLEQLGRPQ